MNRTVRIAFLFFGVVMAIICTVLVLFSFGDRSGGAGVAGLFLFALCYCISKSIVEGEKVEGAQDV